VRVMKAGDGRRGGLRNESRRSLAPRRQEREQQNARHGASEAAR
jgi:hypothetical protein